MRPTFFGTIAGTPSEPITIYRIDAGRTTGGVVDGWDVDTFSVVGATYAFSGATLTGLTNPAPSAVYTTSRYFNVYSAETLRVTGLTPNKNHKIRIHWWNAAIGNNFVVQAYPLTTYREALVKNYDATSQAHIFEVSLVSDGDGVISLAMSGWGTNCFYSGIEVVEVPNYTLRAMTPTSFPNGVAMSQQLTASGGLAPFTFSRKPGSGALPWGVTLGSNGILSGTPLVYRPSQIIVEGDSRSSYTIEEPSDAARTWPSQLANELGDNFTVHNVATGGTTVATMLTQYATEVEPLRDSAKALDVFILFGGYNDISSGRTAADTYADIVTLCSQAQADGFLVIVAIQSLCTSMPNLSEMDSLIASIETNWETFADALVDLRDVSELNQTPLDLFYTDSNGVHYRTPGATLVKDAFLDAIKSLTPNGPTSLLTDADFTFTASSKDANGSIADREYTITVTP